MAKAAKETAKAALEKGASIAANAKGNTGAYAAVGIAVLLGIYFFWGPSIPEPDRSGLIEVDGVVKQKLPKSVTGITEDLYSDSLVGEDSAMTVTPGAPEVSAAVPDPSPIEAPAKGAEAQEEELMPSNVQVSELEEDAAELEKEARPDEDQKTVEVAKKKDRWVGTSAEGATLPAMFATESQSDLAPEATGLMVPAEMVDARLETNEPEKPAEPTMQEKADRGDPEAMYEIAMTFGNDSDDGEKKRFRYLQMAAMRGNVSAMREVAGLHERGEGVLASERMAYIWSTLATAFGEDMSAFRQRIAAKMSADELESGQRAAAATLKGFGNEAMERAKAFKERRES